MKIVAVETEGTPTLFEARRAGKPAAGERVGILICGANTEPPSAVT